MIREHADASIGTLDSISTRFVYGIASEMVETEPPSPRVTELRRALVLRGAVTA